MNIKIKSKGMTCLIGGDYEKIYRSLSQRLNGDYEGLFTERVPGNDYLQWNLPGDGWKPLSESDQITGNEVRRQLDDRLQQVRQLFGNNTVMADKVLTVPNDDYVFYKTDPDGKLRIALTAWGYCNPERVPNGVGSGELPPPEKKENVIILVSYDGMPAANEVLIINGTRHTSNVNGSIDLGPVSTTTELLVEDRNGHKHRMTVAPGSGQVTIDVTSRSQIMVTVMLNGRPKSNANVVVDYCGKRIQLTTGNDGTITTEVIKSRNDRELCSVTVDQQTQQAVLDTEVNTFEFNLSEEIPHPTALQTPPALEQTPPPLEKPEQTPPPLEKPEQTPPPLEKPEQTPPPLEEPEKAPKDEQPKPEEKPKRTPLILMLLLALLIAILTVCTYFLCSDFLHLLQ